MKKLILTLCFLSAITLVTANTFAAEKFKPAADSNGQCVDDVAGYVNLIASAAQEYARASNPIFLILEATKEHLSQEELTKKNRRRL